MASPLLRQAMLGAAQRNANAGPPLSGGSASTPNPQQPVAQAQPAAAAAATNTPNQIPAQAQPVTTPAVPVAPGVPHTLVTSPTPNLAQAQPAVAPIAPAVPVALAASANAPIQNPVYVQSALGQVQPAAAQTQPAAAPPIAITPPARGPLPKSLVVGMMTALVAATTPSQNNATLSTLESIALSAFTTAVTAAEAEALRPPLQEHLTLTTALAVLGSQATTMAERLAVERLAPLLLERDPDCPFKEYSFIYESPNLGSRIDALYVPRQHRPKLHSKRRRMAVAQYQILQLPLPLNQQLQRQMAVQWRAVCNFMYARQERYAKMRQFQSRLSTTLNENLGTGSWILRLNKRVQKKIFSDRFLSPEKLKGRQKSTSLKGNIEGVPYRVKDVRGWIRDADRFRTQLGSKRARWSKTKLQHRLTQGSNIRSRLRGPLVFGLLEQQAGYAVEKLVRDRFASALSYAIEQQIDEHRHYMNRLMARMIKHFHKPATPGRRGGVNWLTPELQGLYSKIQLVYRNEQTIHQKALEETAQQQVISRHNWELLTKQRWEWHQYEREQLRVHHHLSQEVWRWRVRLQDPDLLAEMRLWSRTVFIRPNPPSLTELAAMAPPIPEYSCPVSELLYECSPAVMAWRHQQAALQQTLAQFQEYEARLAQFHDRNLEIKHKSNLEMEKLERKRVSGRTQQERQDVENEMNALFFLTELEHSKVLVEENRLKLAFGEWVNEQKMHQLQDSQHLIPAAQLQLQQQILQAQQQNQQLQQQLQQRIHNQQQHQVQVQQHRQPVQQAGADIVGAPTAPPIPIAIQPAIRAAPAIIITPPQAILPTAPFPISRTSNNLLPLANYPLITTRTRKATDDDIDMDYDPETAIAQYKYTPLHSNLGIAVTLAAMNLEAAIKRLPAYNTCSLVRANLDHGYQHIYHCVLDGSCTPRYSPFGRPSSSSFSSKYHLLIPQLFPLNGLFHPAKQSLISRAGEAAIRAWVYRPKHSDPSAALTLAYMDMLSASATVGFSFCDSLEKMGHIHLNKCIPKEEEKLEKLRKEELIAAETSAVAATANHPTPVAPSVSNVFNFETVPDGGVQIQPPQQSQPHQLPQSQQQQPPSPSNSICTNPTPSRHLGYGSTPSPPIAPPAQEISQPPHTLASTSLPSTPSSSVPAPTPPPVAAVVPAPTSSQRRSKKDKWSANYVKSRKIENSKYRKRRYSSDACDAPSDSSNSSSSSSHDDDSDSEYDSDSDSEFESDDEAYQQWRRRFKKQMHCHATSSKKPSMRTETATTKKSKKVAEFKAWRAKELAQKRRSQEQ
ncbi:hypothetical protein BKA57DRAFT_536946 [Linnemannia elongata]|nr:hypothetical protein BKA57DRAFT_536946 [Linnemannia elongata]